MDTKPLVHVPSRISEEDLEIVKRNAELCDEKTVSEMIRIYVQILNQMDSKLFAQLVKQANFNMITLFVQDKLK